MKHVLLVVSICFFSLTYSQNQAELEKVAYSEFLQSDKELKSLFNTILKEHYENPEFSKRLKQSQELWLGFRNFELESRFPNSEASITSNKNYGICESMFLNEFTLDRIKYFNMWFKEDTTDPCY
jgi:uncharacterized protein YecT (DUF1311 family)